MEEVILVDTSDTPIGTMEKLEAHRLGVLHRAFSVVLRNSKGEMLLQKRADEKYHSGGLWTNTCCSHPLPGESVPEAASRRLKQEMGIHLSPEDLEHRGYFVYKTAFPNGLTEHELDHLLVGTWESDPELNLLEASDFKWIGISDLKKEININPDTFTFWFREIISRELI